MFTSAWVMESRPGSSAQGGKLDGGSTLGTLVMGFQNEYGQRFKVPSRGSLSGEDSGCGKPPTSGFRISRRFSSFKR